LTNLLIKLFIKKHTDMGNSNPHIREIYGQFAGAVGIVTNFLLFVIKAAAGLFFRSIAITADAVNNLSDCGSSIITLVGFKLSKKPADSEHPYGHARYEYISGFIVSFVIIFLGFELFISSVKKIISHRQADFSIISIVILAVAILIKLWQSLFYRKIGLIIDSLALKTASYDSRNDCLASGAVLLAAVISKFANIELDGYMGAAVAVFIVISGVKLVNETISPLLGMAPTKELVDEIYRKILSYNGILGLHDLTVHNYGVSKCFASVHCEVSAQQDLMISHDIIDNIERDFLKDMGIHLVIHLDPVVFDDERTNKLNEEVQKIINDISPEISIHDFRVVWNVSHATLIFDIVTPFGFKWADDELAEIISEKVRQIDEKYYCVITVDHDYIPDR